MRAPRRSRRPARRARWNSACTQGSSSARISAIAEAGPLAWIQPSPSSSSTPAVKSRRSWARFAFSSASVAAARTFLAFRLSSGTEAFFAVSNSSSSAAGSAPAPEVTSWAWVDESSPLRSASSVASSCSSFSEVSRSFSASFGL